MLSPTVMTNSNGKTARDLHHLPRDVDLGLLARADVADDGQADRVRLERKREVRRAAGRQDQRGNARQQQ